MLNGFFSLVLVYIFNEIFVFVQCASCTGRFGANLNIVFIISGGFDGKQYSGELLLVLSLSSFLTALIEWICVIF